MKISIKAILIAFFVGALTDYIAIYVVGIAFLFGLPQSFTEAHAIKVLNNYMQSTNYFFTMSVIGTFTSILAGYIAGQIAKRRVLLHAMMVGLIGASTTFFVYTKVPNWRVFFVIISTVVGALFGGYISLWRKSLTHPSSGTGENKHL